MARRPHRATHHAHGLGRTAGRKNTTHGRNTITSLANFASDTLRCTMSLGSCDRLEAITLTVLPSARQCSLAGDPLCSSLSHHTGHTRLEAGGRRRRTHRQEKDRAAAVDRLCATYSQRKPAVTAQQRHRRRSPCPSAAPLRSPDPGRGAAGAMYEDVEISDDGQASKLQAALGASPRHIDSSCAHAKTLYTPKHGPARASGALRPRTHPVSCLLPTDRAPPLSPQLASGSTTWICLLRTRVRAG